MTRVAAAFSQQFFTETKPRELRTGSEVFVTTSSMFWDCAPAAALPRPVVMRRDLKGATLTAASDSTESTDRAVTYPHLDAAMDRYAQGDASAFTELYQGLAPRLRGFLLRLCGTPALAADLTQETFLRVHRARGSFAERGAAMPWALAIARNVFLDHLRRSRVAGFPHGRQARDEEDDLASRLPSKEAHGEQVVIARETADVIRATLAALPISQREAFVLIRFEGLTLAEASEILGATETAVKLRAFRAYEALRAALRRREEGE